MNCGPASATGAANETSTFPPRRRHRLLVLVSVLSTCLVGLTISTGRTDAATSSVQDTSRCGPAPCAVGLGVRYRDPVFDSATVRRDLVYGSAVDASGLRVALRLDLYQPAGDRAPERPAIVWAHGGGFVEGDKGRELDAAVATQLARRGWIVASVNYRLRQSTDLQAGPVAIPLGALLPAVRDAKHDVQAAIRWLRSKAARYRIDTDTIAATGASAGGMAALHAAFSPDDPGQSGNGAHSSSVAAAAAVSAFVADPTLIDRLQPPISLFHAADDLRIPMALAAETCLRTGARWNHCELHGYLTGGHPPKFLAENRAAILQTLSEFLCRETVPACQ